MLSLLIKNLQVSEARILVRVVRAFNVPVRKHHTDDHRYSYMYMELQLQTRVYMKKHIWWGQTSYMLYMYKRSLDSAVSSLLALISREYAQLVQCTTGLYTEGAPEHMYMYILIIVPLSVVHRVQVILLKRLFLVRHHVILHHLMTTQRHMMR